MSTSQEPACVELSGRLTVGTVVAGRDALLASLQPHDNLVVQIDAQSDVDVAGIQLILAARAFALSKSKTLSLAAPATGPLLDVLRRGGFLESPSDDERKFWLHGEIA
jgi:hypothetical protein